MNSTIGRVFKLSAGVFGDLFPGLSAHILERVFFSPKAAALKPHQRECLQNSRGNPVKLSNGRTVATYQWGEKTAPLIILVHGWGGNAGQMSRFVDPLLQHGYQVVAFDAPAHGASSGKRASLPEFIWAISAVKAHYGTPIGIIAHSMGAAAALISQSTGRAAGKQILISAPHDPMYWLRQMASFLGFSAKVMARTQSNIERRFGMKFELMYGAKHLRQFQGETLIMHDPMDKLVGYNSAVALFEASKNARLMRMEGLGHLRILDDERIIALSLMFLRGDPSDYEMPESQEHFGEMGSMGNLPTDLPVS